MSGCEKAKQLIMIDLIYYDEEFSMTEKPDEIVNPLTTNQYSMGHAYHLYGMEQTTRVEPSYMHYKPGGPPLEDFNQL